MSSTHLLCVSLLVLLSSTPALLASRACDHCSCDLTAERSTTSTLRRSLLVMNCSNSLVSNIIRLPDSDSYNKLPYLEIHAEFKYNKIGKVDKFDLQLLTKLNLANNEIRYIEDGAFSRLTMLRELDLSANKLNKADLNGKTFQNLKSLEVLNLFGTETSSLDGKVFNDLVNLKVLNLGHNFLVGELDPALFSSLTNLQELTIKENVLSQIHSDSFTNLKRLKFLDISGNNLETIKADLFQTLIELVYLDLSNNKLSMIEQDTFRQLEKLVTLNLARNEFKSFDSEFELPRSLRVLRVGNNALEDVGFLKKSFDDLEEVHVEYNRLTNLDFMMTLTQLQVLNVSSNNISASPDQSFPQLRILDLSNNSLPSIPTMLTSHYLPSLRRLVLDANPVRSLQFPPSPRPFLNLNYVSISHMSELKELQAESFAALRTRHDVRGNLQAEGNPGGDLVKREASSFEKFIDPQSDYDDVSDDEKEGTKDGGLGEKEDKEEVDKDGVLGEKGDEEKEGTKDGGLGEIEGTEEVDKDGGVREKEPPGFEMSEEAGMRSEAMRDMDDDVESYNVNENREVAMDARGKAATVMCRGPLVLRISHNKNLVTIEEGTFQGIDICELVLSYNSLNNVPEKMVDWAAVPSIDIQGNPWDCSCRLQWLLEVIVPKLYLTKPELLYELRCGSPSLLSDRRFVHFYNWSEPAFCSQHKDRLRVATAQDETSDVMEELRLGGSGGMLIVIGVSCAVVCALVGAGVWLQRRQTMQRRARNRRV